MSAHNNLHIYLLYGVLYFLLHTHPHTNLCHSQRRFIKMVICRVMLIREPARTVEILHKDYKGLLSQVRLPQSQTAHQTWRTCWESNEVFCAAQCVWLEQKQNCANYNNITIIITSSSFVVAALFLTKSASTSTQCDIASSQISHESYLGNGGTKLL